MKSNIQAILNKRHFFNIVSTSSNLVKYTYEKPSQILIKNISIDWLKYLNVKTQKCMPVYFEESLKKLDNILVPYGLIGYRKFDRNQTALYNADDNTTLNKTILRFKLIIPQKDFTKYFTQWQRYRKYWWSSITTTPSLFSVDEVNQSETEANVNILAHFPFGVQPVEHIKSQKEDSTFFNNSSITCEMALEDALLILLLDGSTISNSEYLRLHRKIAPYKISFALNLKENNIEKLKDLATLLHHRLKIEKLSTWLPNFTIPFMDQVNENLKMGVIYTAILCDSTLEDGIFYLLNSSTTIKEQVHVADFHKYAALICKN